VDLKNSQLSTSTSLYFGIENDIGIKDGKQEVISLEKFALPVSSMRILVGRIATIQLSYFQQQRPVVHASPSRVTISESLWRVMKFD